MRRGLFRALAVLALTTCAGAHDKVVEWIKEPRRTTKIVRIDGRKVYENTWVKRGRGEPRELGPGWLRRPSSAPPPPPPPSRSRPPAPPPRRSAGAPRPAPVPSEARARAAALSLVGVRYQAGGIDPREGLHSAAVPYAFFQELGVESSREILAQYRAGDFVLKSRIRAGDLVFHASGGKQEAVPDMVGVALGGNEMVYMSGSRRKVIRTRYDTPYWEARYKGARRLFGTEQAVPVGSSPWVEPSLRRFEGTASFYGCGDGYDHSGTASGERFDARKLTAAHKELPFGTLLEVTNLSNGRRVEVRVNDRGPYVAGRVLDLSCRAAEVLGFKGAGLTEVRAEVVY